MPRLGCTWQHLVPLIENIIPKQCCQHKTIVFFVGPVMMVPNFMGGSCKKNAIQYTRQEWSSSHYTQVLQIFTFHFIFCHQFHFHFLLKNYNKQFGLNENHLPQTFNCNFIFVINFTFFLKMTKAT